MIKYNLPCGCKLTVEYKMNFTSVDDWMEVEAKSIMMCKQHKEEEINIAYNEYEQKRTEKYHWSLAHAKHILGVKLNEDEQKLVGIKQ
jgi:hypothetical protein